MKNDLPPLTSMSRSQFSQTEPPPFEDDTLDDDEVTRFTRFLCVVGTRPEVIKMAPVIRELRKQSWAHVTIVSSGQQTDLLDSMLADFGLHADAHVPHDADHETPVAFLGEFIQNLDAIIDSTTPDCILAQGDTTTVYASSIAAMYRKIPFVHVEAGLRTGDMLAPFPEEYHRRAVAVGTALHCAPTRAAAMNLVKENIPLEDILVSGNTVIDSLLSTAASMPALPKKYPHQRTILLTLHRRENFGDNVRSALKAVREFVDATPDIAVFFPMHPNPNAREVAREILSDHPRIVLAEPLGYKELVSALQHSWCVLTDSGGIQEEAPALGKPVLVLRDVTERPEAVNAGVAELVGTKQSKVFGALQTLYNDDEKYERMARVVLPYGDGRASKRIVQKIAQRIREGASGQTNVSMPT